MSAHETGPHSPIMPSLHFLYSANGEVAGEMVPLTGPLVEAFKKSEITYEEYLALGAEEDAANQRLSDFMYGNKSPDFMPKVRRVSRWRGWLRGILEI